MAENEQAQDPAEQTEQKQELPTGSAIPISLTKDGDQWCALVGENLQEGVAGFGPTPWAALDALNFEAAGKGEELLSFALDPADVARADAAGGRDLYPVRFRATVKGLQVATDADGVNVVKAGLQALGTLERDAYHLHQEIYPCANRTVDVILLAERPVEQREPGGEGTAHPDQLCLPEGEGFACKDCGKAWEIGKDGHCPECGGPLEAREAEQPATEPGAAG